MDHEMNQHHLVVLNLLHHVYHKFYVYQDLIMPKIIIKSFFSMFNFLLHKLRLNLENVLVLVDHLYFYPDVILLLIFDNFFLFDLMLLFEVNLKFYKNLD